MHDVAVGKDDVLHFVTWGGGGWGDALARDPELVCKEVRRGLVTAQGARRYGVVCSEEGALDGAATEELRSELRSTREEPLPLFNRGGEMEELLANSLAETGLPAPTPPLAV
ncbi:5-Oxoprolinase [Arthrobacter sp. Hiyo4]|nr:5-Oxoprolinase [Arthrobacter sp. Hiyo4]